VHVLTLFRLWNGWVQPHELYRLSQHWLQQCFCCMKKNIFLLSKKWEDCVRFSPRTIVLVSSTNNFSMDQFATESKNKLFLNVCKKRTRRNWKIESILRSSSRTILKYRKKKNSKKWRFSAFSYDVSKTTLSKKGVAHWLSTGTQNNKYVFWRKHK